MQGINNNILWGKCWLGDIIVLKKNGVCHSLWFGLWYPDVVEPIMFTICPNVINNHYLNVRTTTFSCAAWDATELRIIVVIVACNCSPKLYVNLCVLILLAQHGTDSPNSRQGLSVGVIHTTSALRILGIPPTKLQRDDSWMSEFPFLQYLYNECILEPVATFTVFWWIFWTHMTLHCIIYVFLEYTPLSLLSTSTILGMVVSSHPPFFFFLGLEYM